MEIDADSVYPLRLADQSASVVCVFAGAERPSRAADGSVCLDVLGYSRSLMACGLWSSLIPIPAADSSCLV